MKYLLLLTLLLSFNIEAGQHRSYKAKAEFKRLHYCPSTGLPKGSCPGYIVDHVIAIKRGGADNASNMQWQTVEQAKAKDKWE